MQARLAQRSPELELELNRRASHWYGKEGHATDATAYAVAGRDWDRAADLIEPIVARIWAQGHLDTLRHWLSAFPREVLTTRPKLCLYMAWTLVFSGKLHDSYEFLQHAEQGSEGNILVEAGAATLRGYICRLSGDADGGVQHPRQALELLPADAVIQRASAQLALAMGYQLKGSIKESKKCVEESLQVARTTESTLLKLVGKAVRGNIFFLEGKLQAARDVCLRAVEESRRTDLHDPIYAYIQLGSIYREWNDLSQAKKYLDRGMELAKKCGRERYFPRHRQQIGWVQLLEGQQEEAERSIEQALADARWLNNTRAVSGILAWKTCQAIRRGDLAAVDRWCRDTSVSLDEKPFFESEVEHLTLVRVFLAKGELDPLIPFLGEQLLAAEREGRIGTMIEVLLLQALTRRAQEQYDQALVPMKRCLELAEPECYTRLFLDEGSLAEDLVRRAKEKQFSHRYCDHLQAAFEKERGETPEKWILEPLSGREIEVLEWIAAGLSNREIAAKLYISESTVKSHINHVYRKLEVGSRTQAIALAQQLKLIR